ncbi:hypothetical protein [Novipirellula caenicola]|uniref:Uncharacterized protein n=1 Tax=Novipirellula caenicola TaxID=1536901 RepID=A0ABP9VWH1_9BACT
MPWFDEFDEVVLALFSIRTFLQASGEPMANHLINVLNRGNRGFHLHSLAVAVVSLWLTHMAMAEAPDADHPLAAENASLWEPFTQRIEMAPEIQLLGPNPATFPTTAASENAVVVFVRPDADPLSLTQQTDTDTDALLGGETLPPERSGENGTPDDTLAREMQALMKPITNVAVDLGDAAKKVPESIAAVAATSDSFVVMATGSTVAKPQRYTVGFCHQPLYFEQANLERCGNHYGVFQNAVSGLEFLCNVKTLPYHCVTTPPCQCVASPGDCSSCEVMPKQIDPFPLQPKAVMLEAAAIAGFVLLLQ